MNSLEIYSDLSTTTYVVNTTIYNQICRVGFEPTIYPAWAGRLWQLGHRMRAAVIFNETPNGNCLSLSPDYLIRTGDLSITTSHTITRETTTVNCSANWAKPGEKEMLEECSLHFNYTYNPISYTHPPLTYSLDTPTYNHNTRSHVFVHLLTYYGLTVYFMKP